MANQHLTNLSHVIEAATVDPATDPLVASWLAAFVGPGSSGASGQLSPTTDQPTAAALAGPSRRAGQRRSKQRATPNTPVAAGRPTNDPKEG